MFVWIQLFVNAVISWVISKILYYWCLLSGTQVQIERLPYILVLSAILVFSIVLSCTCLPVEHLGKSVLHWAIMHRTSVFCSFLVRTGFLPYSFSCGPEEIYLTCLNNCRVRMVTRWNQSDTYLSPLSWQGIGKTQLVFPLHQFLQSWL